MTRTKILAAPFLTEEDINLFAEGGHHRLYEKLGAHVIDQDGASGTHFAVWAPHAQQVSVVGDFNGWKPDASPMTSLGTSGLWKCFLPGVGAGALYRYAITPQNSASRLEKLDPYGFAAEYRHPPASRVWDLLGYPWSDREWMARRAVVHSLESPISIYEVHLGSWMRVPEEVCRPLTYRELAPKLAQYAREMGYTHVELLPVMEHTDEDSWGYRPLAFFAPSSRFGTPQDFMFLVDTLHQQGIGVILDWIGTLFPPDEHGLAKFDGEALYEPVDSRQGEQEYGQEGFDYARPEVRNFLTSNAVFWLDTYHIDGLRVASVASMLYRISPSSEGAKSTQPQRGQENQEAVAFIRGWNQAIFAEFPDTLTIAEESTAWRRVSRPPYLDGLGFSLTWDLGWMHDTVKYISFDPFYRQYHHQLLTFRQLYAFTENYVLPLAHDEVVHGKKSLLAKMPGDDWQKFANLRLLLGYLYAQPGKKLLFMGGEFAQWQEWNPDASLDWHLLEYPLHRGLQRWVRDLNTLYRGEPALHQMDCDPKGFEWVDCHDAQQSVLSFLRQGKDPNDVVLVVCNFTPQPRQNYRVGVSQAGHWEEILNSDAGLYGGSRQGNMGGVNTAPISWHGRSFLLNLTLPPLGMVMFKRKG